MTAINGDGSSAAVRAERLCVLDGARIAIRYRSSTQVFAWEEIICARAAKNGTWIVTRHGEFKIHEPIGAVVARLEAVGFVQIHRAVAVNAAKVRRLVGQSQHRLGIILDDGQVFQVGRQFQRTIRGRYGTTTRVPAR